MKIMNGERGSGKTVAAIQRAYETGAYIITFNHDESCRIMTVATELGFNIRYPVTITEFLNGGMRGSRVRNVILDNADMVLKQIFQGFDIELMTMTMEGDSENG
jgi:hypothetical protein